MSSEIIRRLKCTSTDVPEEKFVSILKDYMDDLAAMGYSLKWREEVLHSVMRVYTRFLFKESQGETKRIGKGRRH